jgi:hypothetical protein
MGSSFVKQKPNLDLTGSLIYIDLTERYDALEERLFKLEQQTKAEYTVITTDINVLFRRTKSLK